MASPYPITCTARNLETSNPAPLHPTTPTPYKTLQPSRLPPPLFPPQAFCRLTGVMPGRVTADGVCGGEGEDNGDDDGWGQDEGGGEEEQEEWAEGEEGEGGEGDEDADDDYVPIPE